MGKLAVLEIIIFGGTILYNPMLIFSYYGILNTTKIIYKYIV